MDYPDSHAVVMAGVSDLHIMRFDQVFAKTGHVLLRHTAEGSHVGKPYNGIKATNRHAVWKRFKVSPRAGSRRPCRSNWAGLLVTESSDPGWNAKALAEPETSWRRKD
ncbi:hypothetical protein Z517_10610 [Fonsecaea pedrosoi CBS 271.37]|uniref:Uncharacterized protein n=1 Tax=Fonsecaea pedrosoi CBS 271.37 TaxID=1442368 RepID=A0A0D2GAL4_9EURO|nr:uncharacterized protein Z517_10610 [Fonsecaea pedrosoi CBS 271.37]KIW75865.1 hypothetical protein Z517_10610 [Fonsecaea pedrosoi CBS 271.37]